MTRSRRFPALTLLTAAWLINSCGNDNPGGQGSSPRNASTQTATAGISGNTGAPISIRYNVLGKAIVGQPLGISLEIFSANAGDQVTVHYRINDETALQFPESQSRSVEFRVTRIEEPQIEQVTVIPQREGRLFLNVSAEIEGQDGSTFKALAIPIQAGAAPEGLPSNGARTEDPDSEAVISMPVEDR